MHILKAQIIIFFIHDNFNQMKKKFIYLVIVTILFQAFFIKAQGETPVTFNVVSAGTLSSQIGNSIDSVDSLTIVGNLNGSDIVTLRNMDRLSVLNLTDANIVGGGDYYYYTLYYVPMSGTHRTLYYTADNILGAQIFNSCSNLTSVKLPNSVTSIGAYSFASCKNLKSVYIPDGVLNVDSYAFYGCSALTSIVIPNSVITIGNSVFFDCSNLTNVKLSDEITSIGDATFYGCQKLKSIVIPAKVKALGSNVFNVGLNELHIKAVSPPITNSTFTNVDLSICKLFVPCGTIDAYRSAPGWSDFVDIKEEGYLLLNLIFKSVK